VSPWAYVAAFAASALVSVFLVAVSIRVAPRVGLVDGPDGGRKTQEHAVPKLGGIAVAITFTVAFLVLSIVVGDPGAVGLAASVLLPALCVALIGFLDDVITLGPWLRLGTLSLFALVVWWTGTRAEISQIWWIDLLVTVIWIVGITNAVNLLDNSDGLAASTTLVASLGAGAIAALYGQYLIAGLSFALAGAALGFLWHNWHPASVYLGDAGAYFLGFLLAIVTLRLRPVSIDLPWSGLIPVLLLLLPIVDTCFVVLRRLRERRHPFTPGRDHLSHLLMDRGLTVPRAVGALQGLLVISVLCAIGLAYFLR
jgi:UDP-GlcNAc:undecaprenyl-phosphate/decaprenyl-phosphate GlcNAc-1-phosphate transferase